MDAHGEKNSEEKCLMWVQRTARERGGKYMWKQSWERQRAAYIQNREMQISQKLAEMFKLVLNTLEAKAGNYRQTCFVWLAQCFKQSWIRCQHIKIGSFFFFFLILSFPWKLEEQEKPATWQHCAELGGSCPPLASYIFLGSPWGPAACFMHQITCQTLEAFASAAPALSN